MSTSPTAAISVPRKVSAPDMVCDALRSAILSGEFPAGMPLRQDDLAERFGTSRIPVREALRHLEAEGLVELHANRGAVVASLSLEEVLEMLDIRIALETRAIRLAIPNMLEEDFEAIAAVLRSYDAEPRLEQWGEMNWRFHSMLYLPCNRPRLLAMIEANYGHVSRFTRVQVSLASGKERPQREHYAILDACRAQDTDRAAELLDEHITHTQKSLLASARRASLTIAARERRR